MSLLRRNKAKDKEEAKQAAPAAKPAKEKKEKKESSSGGLKQWLIDSYNGLYKIVLEPSMPTRATVMLVLAGVVIGLLWAYAISPTVFTGANPNRLNQPAQDQWILMVAGNYERRFYDVNQAVSLLSRVDNPVAAIDRMLSSPTIGDADRNALEAVRPLVVGVRGEPTPQDPGFIGNLLSGFLVPLILVTILVPVFTLLWRLLIYPNLVAPVIMKIQEARDPELAAKNQKARADLKRLQEQKAELERLKKETVADAELGEPVTQVLKVFSKGRNFDESDEIETATGDFLGQFGAVIPESIEPDPAAIELWVFDMRATNQNAKKLFITPTAASDSRLQARLSSDPDVTMSDAVVTQVGAKLVIDTENLRVQGEILQVDYDDKGRFENFRMKITAWKRASDKAPAPQPTISYVPHATPQPVYQPPTAPQPPAYQPPAAPVYSPPPPPSGVGPQQPLRPLSPQPLSSAYPPPPEDDDPFGSTGDFTPIPRQ